MHPHHIMQQQQQQPQPPASSMQDHTAVTRNASAPEQSTSAFSSSAGLSLHATPIHIDTSPSGELHTSSGIQI